MIARALEKEIDAPDYKGVMRKLAAEYEALADQIQEIDADRKELMAHIETCHALAEAMANPVQKAILTNLIRYLERKLNKTAELKHLPAPSTGPEHFTHSLAVTISVL
jgi:hypothetical protein